MNAPKLPAANAALRKAADQTRANNTPQNLNLTINLLVQARMICPAVISGPKGALPKPDAEGKIQLPKNTKVSFALLKASDGKQYFMGFTDPEELKKWSKNTVPQTVLLRFDDYAAMLASNQEAAGFVLNPFGANLRFDRSLVESVKKQKEAIAKAKLAQQQNQIKPGDKVTIVEPSSYPDGLLEPICKVLEQDGTIAAAYLQIMIVNETRKAYLLVLDGPKKDPLFVALAKAAQPYLMDSGKKIDMNITISATPLGQQGMRGSEAFYVQGKGRIIYDEEDDG